MKLIKIALSIACGLLLQTSFEAQSQSLEALEDEAERAERAGVAPARPSAEDEAFDAVLRRQQERLAEIRAAQTAAPAAAPAAEVRPPVAAISDAEQERIIGRLITTLKAGGQRAAADDPRAQIGQLTAAKVNIVKDRDGDYLLHAATLSNNPELVRAVANIRGIDPDVKNDRQQTPLHIAATVGDPEAIEILCRIEPIKPTDDNLPVIDLGDENDETPLLVAIRAKNILAAEKFVEFNADITYDDRDQNSPTLLAIKYGFVDFATALLSKVNPETLMHVNKHKHNVIHMAVASNDSGMVERVISQIQRSPAILKTLLETKNQENGNTPLHLAAKGQGDDPANGEIVQTLVAACRSVEIEPNSLRNKTDATPFGVALWILVNKYKQVKLAASAAKRSQLAVTESLATTDAQKGVINNYKTTGKATFPQ